MLFYHEAHTIRNLTSHLLLSGPIAKSIAPRTTEIHAMILDGLETLGVQRNPESVRIYR